MGNFTIGDDAAPGGSAVSSLTEEQVSAIAGANSPSAENAFVTESDLRQSEEELKTSIGDCLPKSGGTMTGDIVLTDSNLVGSDVGISSAYTGTDSGGRMRIAGAHSAVWHNWQTPATTWPFYAQTEIVPGIFSSSSDAKGGTSLTYPCLYSAIGSVHNITYGVDRRTPGLLIGRKTGAQTFSDFFCISSSGKVLGSTLYRNSFKTWLDVVPATAASLGVVKPGTGLTVDSDGTLHVDGGTVDLSGYVTLATSQTISGSKDFTGNVGILDGETAGMRTGHWTTGANGYGWWINGVGGSSAQYLSGGMAAYESSTYTGVELSALSADLRLSAPAGSVKLSAIELSLELLANARTGIRLDAANASASISKQSVRSGGTWTDALSLTAYGLSVTTRLEQGSISELFKIEVDPTVSATTVSAATGGLRIAPETTFVHGIISAGGIRNGLSASVAFPTPESVQINAGTGRLRLISAGVDVQYSNMVTAGNGVAGKLVVLDSSLLTADSLEGSIPLKYQGRKQLSLVEYTALPVKDPNITYEIYGDLNPTEGLLATYGAALRNTGATSTIANTAERAVQSILPEVLGGNISAGGSIGVGDSWEVYLGNRVTGGTNLKNVSGVVDPSLGWYFTDTFSSSWNTTTNATAAGYHFYEFELTALNNKMLSMKELTFEWQYDNGTTDAITNPLRVNCHYAVNNSGNYIPAGVDITEPAPATGVLGCRSAARKVTIPLTAAKGTSLKIRLCFGGAKQITQGNGFRMYWRNIRFFGETLEIADPTRYQLYNPMLPDGAVKVVSMEVSTPVELFFDVGGKARVMKNGNTTEQTLVPVPDTSLWQLPSGANYLSDGVFYVTAAPSGPFPNVVAVRISGPAQARYSEVISVDLRNCPSVYDLEMYGNPSCAPAYVLGLSNRVSNFAGSGTPELHEANLYALVSNGISNGRAKLFIRRPLTATALAYIAALQAQGWTIAVTQLI